MNKRLAAHHEQTQKHYLIIRYDPLGNTHTGITGCAETQPRLGSEEQIMTEFPTMILHYYIIHLQAVNLSI